MIYAATATGEVVQIKPITNAGEVGTVVMGFAEEPLAMAR